MRIVPALRGYGNPFTGSLTIAFTLAHTADIDIDLYSTNGDRIAQIASGRYDAGHHEILWRAADLPSGAYLYRLRAGTQVTTGTVIHQR